MFRGFFPGGRFSNAPPKISPRFPHLRREIQTEPSAVSSNISPEGFQLTIESFHWIRSGCLPHPGSIWGNEIPTTMGRFFGGTILDAESLLVPFGKM